MKIPQFPRMCGGAGGGRDICYVTTLGEFPQQRKIQLKEQNYTLEINIWEQLQKIYTRLYKHWCSICVYSIVPAMMRTNEFSMWWWGAVFKICSPKIKCKVLLHSILQRRDDDAVCIKWFYMYELLRIWLTRFFIKIH